MNYIENKMNFESNYAKVNIDLVLKNYIPTNYSIIDYQDYLNNMKYYSNKEIITMCIEFFNSIIKEKEFDIIELLNQKRIIFLNEDDELVIKESITDGKTIYENGIVKCLIVEKNTLYDLFILVHELTHLLTLSKEIKEEFKEEFLLFSEVLPFHMEDCLIQYLSKDTKIKEDLDKCIKARSIILKNIVKEINERKDNLAENIDIEFRYLISIIYKNNIKLPVYDASYNIGTCNIVDIIDFNS